MEKNKRQSGIEILRIICMLFILLGHTFFMQNTDLSYVHSNVVTFSLVTFVNSVGVAAVNTFVIISGWFGIRYNTKGLFKFLFQFFFLLWLLWLVAFFSGLYDVNTGSVKNILGAVEGYWFVFAYVGLYILSPILNYFAEKASKQEFRNLLLVFYVFQCFYTWMTDMVNYFNGYGITFFCGLYLTARYIKKYPIDVLTRRTKSIYFCCVLCIAFFAVIGYYYLGNALRMLRYDNPLVIISAIAAVIFFSRKSFYSRMINWLAASAFSVYIIHFHPFVFPYYGKFLQDFLGVFPSELMAGGYVLYICCVYLLCTLIDQFRVLAWNLVKRI